MATRTVRTEKRITGESLSATPIEGWTPPLTNAEVSRRFFEKHGNNLETRAIDRKWRRLGAQV